MLRFIHIHNDTADQGNKIVKYDLIWILGAKKSLP